MRQFRLVAHDRGCARPHFSCEGKRVRLQGQMLLVWANNIELVVIARSGAGHEQFPIAHAAHAHRMPARIPEIEIADHTDPPRIGSEYNESHAIDAVECHRMRAELIVEPLMGASANK